MKKREKGIRLLIYIILVSLIIVSIIYIAKEFYWKKEAVEETKIVDTIEVDESKVTKESTKRMIQVKSLQQENSDIVGFLEIENTNISYPVVQGLDNEYYMTHNYKKEKSKNGAIFLDKDYDWNIQSNNYLIYGHNLNNGTMFQELLKYADESYYKEHSKILFTTADEEESYDIISVFKSKVYYISDDVFKYYFFINPETEEEYNDYIKNVKELSLYDIEETAQYGTQLITLSTCSYHVKDGRFVIVGAKREKQEEIKTFP